MESRFDSFAKRLAEDGISRRGALRLGLSLVVAALGGGIVSGQTVAAPVEKKSICDQLDKEFEELQRQERLHRDEIKRLDDAIKDHLGGEQRQTELKARKAIAEALLAQVLSQEADNRAKWRQNNCACESTVQQDPSNAAFALADRRVDQTVCCPSGQTPCGSTCCSSGQTCDNGTCRSGQCTTASQCPSTCSCPAGMCGCIGVGPCSPQDVFVCFNNRCCLSEDPTQCCS
jgi:hypothetical protein